MRRALILGVAGLFASALVLSSMAEARVGGGGFSGSRGSRSYSAPRAPIAPSAPVRPAVPGQSPYAQTAPPSRGFLGGFGGMLGGFVLGGLLGSLLFGGGGLGMGAGIGLLDLLLMAGLAFLLISFFRRREPQPAMAGGGPAAGGWPGAAAAAPRGGAGATPAPPVPDEEDVERGIAHIRSMDPAFDPARLADVARDLFTRLQIGWSGGDLAAVRAHLTDEMAVALEQDLARLQAQKRRNHVERVQVRSTELTEAWQEYGRDLVTVRLTASAVDYTVDTATGAVVEGSKTEPVSFTEYWTLARPVGPNPWRVSAIQQPPA